MADIELRLRKACENINITYVDCDVVLNKAKMRKKSHKFSWNSLFNLKVGIGTLAVATACVGIIAIPSLLGNRDSMMPSSNQGENSAQSDKDVSRNFEPIIKNETISESFDVDTLKTGTLEVLRKKANTRSFTKTDETQEFASFVNKVNTYGGALFENINADNTEKKNTAYSPASVFYALSMLSEVCEGDDKQAVLDILGVSKEDLQNYLPSLYRACNKTYINENGKMTGKERIDNSMWFDEKFSFDGSTLDRLSSVYFSNLFSGDFFIDNENMSNQISKYVKKSTEGALNPSYQMDLNTTFAIINSLYFTDMWNFNNLPLTFAESKEFKQYDNSTVTTNYYYTDFVNAKINETEKYKSMFAKTYDGFQIDFIVPKEGVSVDDLFKDNVMNAYKSSTYTKMDENYSYYSRVEFPEFKASFDGNILDNIYECYDLEPITNFGNFATKKVTGDNEFRLSSIRHTTMIDMNKDELVGAEASTNNLPDREYSASSIKEETFVVDGSFIYTIKDPTGIILFEGVIYNL